MWGSWEESLVIDKIKILLLTKTSSKIQNSLGRISIVVKEEEFVCIFGEREGQLQREREKHKLKERRRRRRKSRTRRRRTRRTRIWVVARIFLWLA